MLDIAGLRGQRLTLGTENVHVPDDAPEREPLRIRLHQPAHRREQVRINAVLRVAHVGVEVLESQPPLADVDAPAAVTVICGVVRIQASLLHAVPAAVDRRTGAPLALPVARSLLGHALARFRRWPRARSGRAEPLAHTFKLLL